MVAMELASSQGDDAARLEAMAGLAESLLEQQEVDAARVHVDQLAVEAPESLPDKVVDSPHRLHRRGLGDRTAKPAADPSGSTRLSARANAAGGCPPA